MFYVKKEIGNDIEVKIDLYDDEIYTQCPICGEEIQIDGEFLAEILNDGDLIGTSVYCDECTRKRKNVNSRGDLNGKITNNQTNSRDV